MERSSRSAGVRPSRIMQCHKLRSFTISLVIVLVTTRSPASGFTIRRIEPSESTSELETGGSSLLEVRYDLRTSQNNATTTATVTNATINLSDIIVTTSSEIPILNTSERYLNDSNPSSSSVAADDQTTIAATSTVIIQSRSVDQNLAVPTTVKSWYEQGNEQELATETISEDSQNYSIETPVTVNLTTEQSLTNDTQHLKYNEVQDNITENTNIITTTEETPITFMYTSISGDDNTSHFTEASHATQESTSNKFNLEVFIKSVDDTINKSSSNVTSDITTDTGFSIISESPTVVEESFKVTMIDFTTDTSDPYLENDKPTTTQVPIVEAFTRETMKDGPVPITLSTEITTFEKKPFKEISHENKSDINMTTIETGQTVLEKVLNNTPIPSLKQLKNLLVTQEYTTKIYEINVTSASELENSTVQKIDSNVGTVASKRGGYIDNTDTTSSKHEKATTAQYVNLDNVNDTEPFGSMYEAEGSDGEVVDASETKNITGLESQSQLAEDAIKEELLMEKTLHENEYIETSRQIVPSPGVTTQFPDITPTIHEVITEDVLSVKPINNDKKKSIALYSPSPYYKPFKKLDIQPTKQFNRDPDDNSWRNESISSLGIVFNPKNASKSFTDVLKNKTTELNKSEKKLMNEVPDLKIRLEKIAEVRKSKKKKINIYGDSVYVDYDESSVDNRNIFKEEVTSPMSPSLKSEIIPTSTLSPSSLTTDSDIVVNYIQKENFKMFRNEFSTPHTSMKKKTYHVGEYYDSGDDYDADYVTKIDLKKFSTTTKPQAKANNFRSSSQDFVLKTQNLYPATYMPDRQPTVQYFPPTKKYTTTVRPEVTQKVNIDEYDDQFKNKVNQFAYTQAPNSFFGTVSPAQTSTFDQPEQTMSSHAPSQNDEDLKKTLYLTSQSRAPDMHGSFVSGDGNINKASYVIKHYKDFIVDAAQDGEDDHHLPFTVAPIQYVKIDGIDKLATQKEPKRDAVYDYGTQLRKDNIVSRFVDNFNQNSDKFKVNFPIIFNNSVAHRTDENGHVLVAPRTFMKRLYGTISPRADFLSNVKPCDANCESMRVVDLSPAYELHYYVPDQEEKEEIEPRHNGLPYQFRL